MWCVSRFFRTLFCFGSWKVAASGPNSLPSSTRPIPALGKDRESSNVRAAKTLARSGIPNGVAIRTKAEVRTGEGKCSLSSELWLLSVFASPIDRNIRGVRPADHGGCS